LANWPTQTGHGGGGGRWFWWAEVDVGGAEDFETLTLESLTFVALLVVARLEPTEDSRRRHRCHRQTASIFSLPFFLFCSICLSLADCFGLRPSLGWSDCRRAHRGGAALPPMHLPPPPFSLSRRWGSWAGLRTTPSLRIFQPWRKGPNPLFTPFVFVVLANCSIN